MNRAMTKILTHTRMIIIPGMVKHAVSILLASSLPAGRQAFDLFNQIIKQMKNKNFSKILHFKLQVIRCISKIDGAIMMFEL